MGSNEVLQEGAYTPQVEAVSPTPSADDATRSTKEDLLQEIHKVDRDIAQTEHKITQLKVREADLEEQALQPVEEQNEEHKPEAFSTPSLLSLSQQIYAENRVSEVSRWLGL